jgi:hypothetical protein
MEARPVRPSTLIPVLLAACFLAAPASAHHPAQELRDRHVRAATMERLSQDAQRWDRVRHWRAVRVKLKRQRARALREHRCAYPAGWPAANRRLGQCLAARRGWTGTLWGCLDVLWGRKESGWDETADNPRSDAYGIPQALPGSKMGRGWRHNVRVQIRWGLAYVAGRYGTPCGALAFHRAHNWY